MSRRRVIIVSNDVVPGQAMPVAAPGLRALGLASGLRQHGFDVTTVAMQGPVESQWEDEVPPPIPSNTIVLTGSDLMEYIRSRSPVNVIFTNSNQAPFLEPSEGVGFVMDFFAPKMLELVCGRDEYSDTKVESLRERKLRAIQLADAIVVNGRKKVPYVLGWILQTDRDPRTLPLEVAEMCVTGRFEDPEDRGERLRMTIAGYAQSWSHPGSWIEMLHRPLQDQRLELVVVMPPHWGQSSDLSTNDQVSRLTRFPGVSQFDALPFAQFRSAIAGSDLALDLFDYSLEREYAMVTRTVVSISTGLPVIHPPFTEVTPLIEEFDAGWIVDPSDEEGLQRLLEDLINEPEQVLDKRHNAKRLWEAHFDPRIATAGLIRVLDKISSP